MDLLPALKAALEQQAQEESAKHASSSPQLASVEHGEKNHIPFKVVYDAMCNRIRATNILDDVMKDFQGLKSDLERVKYVSKMNEIVNLCVSENFTQKSLDDALSYEKVYDQLIPSEASAAKALDVIKKSIQKTPTNENSSLATRYMKRGWAFLLLEQFPEASSDAKYSLTFNAPEETLWNSYEILGHCCSRQKDFKNAETYFMKSLENLRKSNVSNDVKAVATQRIVMVFKTVKGKKNKSKKKIEPPESNSVSFGCGLATGPQAPTYGNHETFITATSAIDIVVTKAKGRMAIAKKDIKPGDLIIVDSPYVTSLNFDLCSSHCHHCHKRCNLPFPCNSCAKVVYCSASCRDTAWETLHKIECPVLNNLECPVMGKLAPISFRILVKITWSNLQNLRPKILDIIEEEKPTHEEIEFIDTSNPKSDSTQVLVMENLSITDGEKFKWPGKYKPDDFMAVFNLVTNSSKRSFGDMFKRTIMAIYIAQCLRAGGYFPSQDISEEDMLFVSSLVLRFSQSASCNAYEISEFDAIERNLNGSSMNEIGGAIYPTISFVNHGCVPNTVRYCIGTRCILRAIRTIPKGTEVYDNYGYHYHSINAQTRLEGLRTQYKFECECDACMNTWPLYPHSKENFLTLRCPGPNCGTPCSFSYNRKYECNICGNKQEYTLLCKEVEKQMEEYSKAVSQLVGGKSLSALPTLLNHQRFLDHCSILPNKHCTDVLEAIKHCYHYQGNTYIRNST
ncbi:unnamed protein product [Meganyctiphanes norvegica]|uniref:Protein-lysine N-methyltransferase SMYD4 n=1 Tax=Meganyctiphanes norvegica TaxID=48144 RepID=A0AAV2RIP0_MEGNR